jgi:hypothetical protein
MSIFQWGSPILFIVWTVSWGLLHLIVLFLQPYFFSDRLPHFVWFTFLTNWSYTMLALYSVIESVSAIYVNIKRKDIVNGGKIIDCCADRYGTVFIIKYSQ